MQPIIKFDNITFSYKTEDDNFAVLENFSIDFCRGEFCAVLGHNGSGKSTIAKLSNGLLLPNSGKIYVNGMDTADENNALETKKQIGIVFQNPDNQLVATVVEEDVAFGPENLGVNPEEIRQRVDEALKTVDMTKYKNSTPSKLSGGQKQRIAIAGILAMKPQCIVFDEPTAMLDPKGRKEVMDVILKLREQGITVILITHYMEEAALADRVVVMNDGKIIIDGKPGNVFSKVELLKTVGLDVPQSTELIYMLKNEGFDLDETIISNNDCVEAITHVLEEK